MIFEAGNFDFGGLDLILKVGNYDFGGLEL